jgi:hypothetical protein
MERANPAQQRKAIEMANKFVRHGIQFVPMPVLDSADLEQLVNQSQERIEQIAARLDSQTNT